MPHSTTTQINIKPFLKTKQKKEALADLAAGRVEAANSASEVIKKCLT